MPHFIHALQGVHVLVAGDVILDRYWSGTTSRISPEAPVPVVRVEAMEDRPGGAGNVAVNITSLDARATLLGVTGRDEPADTLKRLLAERGVDCLLTQAGGFQTITKLRVLSQHQQLIRLDFEDGPRGLDAEGLLPAFTSRLAETQAVVLSDYAKGTLGDTEEMIRLARMAGKPVIVDPKGRDFSRYRGATLITPNLKEFQAIVGDWSGEAEMEEKARRLADELRLDALLITRGEQGMTLVPRAGDPLHFSARAREVYDVTGAGDTVVAVLAVALGAGHGLAHATALANTAAGLVVAKLGTATVSPAELEAALHEEGNQGPAILDEVALIQEVESAHRRGETIVMTNGCFDLVHAGHVAYLTEARQLGDRLIVAVNDDASVARLKGRERPINPLSQRMAVLSALKPVDWVVPFTEDTPERLICRVKPDILVKGGDYAPEQIAGGDCVTAAGGKVLVLPYREGCSTSRILETARRRGDT
jgi:D-beta-D-heptose 7-phosphate kinase/D-beta-D-heptose 1-phosphate adenosyltransferase